MSTRYEADIISVMRALVTARFFLLLNASITNDGSWFLALPLPVFAGLFTLVEFLLLVGVWRMKPDWDNLMQTLLGIWSFLLIVFLLAIDVPFVGGAMISITSLLVILTIIVPILQKLTENQVDESEA